MIICRDKLPLQLQQRRFQLNSADLSEASCGTPGGTQATAPGVLESDSASPQPRSYTLRARARGPSELDLNFWVLICLRPIIAFRQEITKLCRFPTLQASFAFGNNFDCAKCYERRGNRVR